MKYEHRLGIDSYLISPDPLQTMKQTLEDGTELQSWDFANKNDIHVIHSEGPKYFRQCKNTIFLVHATPGYSLSLEQDKTWDSFTMAMNMLYDCKYSVTLHQRHIPYWRPFVKNPENLIYIPSGVDLEKWTPQGETAQLNQPNITFMDVGRIVKSPRDFLFAMDIVGKEYPGVTFNLAGMPPNQHLLWNSLLAKSHIDRHMANFVTELLEQPELVYRGTDLLVSHCIYGDITRVAMEAMACGCPVIMPSSNNPCTEGYKEGYPENLAKKIIKVLKRNEKDKTKLRWEAREIAEKYYDVEKTAKGMAELYDIFYETGGV